MSEEVAVSEKHFVVYTDGGCRPSSRGFGGYGLHGYVFTNTQPKQGSGAKATPTAVGYAEGKQKDSAVEVLQYVDCWSTVEGESTNNVAELMAAMDALQLTLTLDVKSVLLIMDSKYVMDGLNENLAVWKNNGWKRADGESISSRSLWEQIDAIRNTIESKGIAIRVEWVRGHSGDLGNALANMLATRGVFLCMKNLHKRVCNIQEAKGYWNLKADYNRLLAKSSWYFNTNADMTNTRDGKYVYHLGKHGDDDNLFGKRVSDVSFSVVYLADPDPVLETIREYQNSVTNGVANSVIIARLDVLQQPKNYSDILLHKSEHLSTIRSDRIDIINADDVVLTVETRPARLAFRAVDTLIALESLLDDYLSMKEGIHKNIVVTDITDRLFDITDAPKGKKVCKLKKEFGTDTRAVDIPIGYDTGKRKGVINAKLLFNMDLPSRNMLSAIASDCPTVKVLSFPESLDAIRYASIVEVGNDIGIWSTIFSNMRILEGRTGME